MEHQEKEAMKTLQQAEELFKANDLGGALMLARKARGLFPSLSGLINVLVAYHVHAAAREKNLPSGKTDWHSVLGVAPPFHPEVIKKQYKVMRLLTHPDKCKTAAAEGAFKLLEKAWRCINSSSRPTSGSITNPEPKNISLPHSPPPPDRIADARRKPATRNSDGKLVRPHCQSEFGCKIAVDNPVLCKRPSCHGCAVITPENKYTDLSSCREPENGLPPRHERTPPPSPPPPPRPGTAEATSFTQHSSSQSRIPNFLLCPFCGIRNSYTVIDGLCHVTCKQCGVPSSIRADGASSDRSDQTGGASQLISQPGVAMCRKCRTPYDGKIPNNRRILQRCKLCGSWASVKPEIEQIRVHDEQQRAPAANLPNQTAGSGDKPSDSSTAGDLVRCPCEAGFASRNDRGN